MSRFHLVMSVSTLCLGVVCAEVPRTPFAGVYGATNGAGSLTGWSRHGGGNPAVIAKPGYGVSLAGYAPYGLEGLRAIELEGFRDGARWGASAGWRQLADGAGPNASRVRIQAAGRVLRGLYAGAFVATHLPGKRSPDSEKFGGGDAGWGAGCGLRVRPHPALSLGLLGESVPSPFGRMTRAGFGADAGTSLSRVLGAGSEGRVAVEYFREFGRAPGLAADEWRFAFGLRLHALLGVYAGYVPHRETAALGVAFGVGGWEGFSAVRRHRALGSTAVQGMAWSSAPP